VGMFFPVPSKKGGCCTALGKENEEHSGMIEVEEFGSPGASFLVGGGVCNILSLFYTKFKQ